METCLTFELIEMCATVLTALTAVISVPIILVQYAKSKKQKRAEFILQLHHMFINDKDMMEMFYKIEYGDFKYDAKMHMSLEEQKLDKLLGHFNNICRLYEMNVIEDKDFEIFRYEISRVAQNKEVRKYFDFLDYWFNDMKIPGTKYQEIRRINILN